MTRFGEAVQQQTSWLVFWRQLIEIPPSSQVEQIEASDNDHQDEAEDTAQNVDTVTQDDHIPSNQQ